MEKEKKYLELSSKIKNCISHNNKRNDVVSVLLFRNYLTELFALKKELGNNSEFIKNPDAHNIFLDIKPDWLGELKNIDSFIDDLKQNNINISTGRYLNGLFVYLYTYWELYKDSKELSRYGKENIYLSTIKILQRIKDIYVYGGQFEIGDFTFKNEDKYQGYKLPSLDDDFLDYIEKKCSDIPNQEQTNQLWEEFQNMKK
ncbi:MAG: hypothetical protein LBE36_13990 [Flavobacteriaceae bacterium]|jgi:hypothetical protein|nr:hypothetical protein [Flavobacteriaceae bacterium]